jgi:hypothetical protein
MAPNWLEMGRLGIAASGGRVRLDWSGVGTANRLCATASTRWLALMAIGAVPRVWAILGTFRRKIPKFAIGLAVDRALGSAALVASALYFDERHDRTPPKQLVV